MVKLTGTTQKARYQFKIHKADVDDIQYLLTKLPKKVWKFSKHCKKRMKEKNFRVTHEELNKLLKYRYLLDIQFGYDGKVTFVYRGNLGRSYDTTFVIDMQGVVISVWANHKSDNHKTLDESIYRKNIKIKDVL